MTRVVGRADALPEHRVVARQLALAAELAADQPGQRVEPQRCEDDLGGDLDRPVGAHDVRELVTQDDADPGVAP